MLILGITGGIGTGKGLATDFFRTRGAPIIDADEIARDLMHPGSHILSRIAATFGPSFLTPDGALDRRRLAQAVFPDPDALASLNAITHPPIKAEIQRRIAALPQHPHTPVACLVAPLLLEAGLRQTVDRLLVMVAREDERVRRVIARDGLTEQEVRSRIAAQMPPSDQIRQADWVVDTSGPREHACRQLERIWAELNASPESLNP